MRLSVAELDLLIYVLEVRHYQYDERELMHKLQGIRDRMKEETNELEANEN